MNENEDPSAQREVDPYLSPEEDAVMLSESWAWNDLRGRFLKEEMAVLAVGWIYYYMGSILIGLSVCSLIVIFPQWELWQYDVYLVGVALFMGGVIYLLLGYGLRRFDAWARTPALVGSLLLMFFLPIGFLVSPICFLLLRINAAKELFTHEYQTAVVEEGEMIDHYGWLAVVAGLLSSVTLLFTLWFLSQGLLKWF